MPPFNRAFYNDVLLYRALAKYNDGNDIPLVTDSAAWANLTTPGYCFYNNTTDTDSIVKFGALYNWYTVNTGKLAPSGWRVPTDDDWTTLQNYLIANGYNWDGTTTGNKIAKSMAAKTDWSVSTNAGAPGNNLTSNNSSGFSSLPSGYRSGEGSFYYIGNNGAWWNTLEDDANFAFHFYLLFNQEYLSRTSGHKRIGYSVRLVRDSDYTFK